MIKVKNSIRPIHCRFCDETMQQAVEEANEKLQALASLPEQSEEELPVVPRCAKRAITEQNQYLMHSMLRDVIQLGTARKARVIGRKDIAGKTGTTNDQKDAWFKPGSTTIWPPPPGSDLMMFPRSAEVRLAGGPALPAWIDFMQVALNGIEEKSPDMPPGMLTMRIDSETGKPVNVGHPNAIFEVFEVDKAPKPPKHDLNNNRRRGQNESSVNAIEDPF